MEEAIATPGRGPRVVGRTSARETSEAIPLRDRLLLSEVEVAEVFGVSRWTVRKWLSEGLLRPVRLPLGCRRNLYRRTDVEAFVARLPVEG